MSATGSTSFVSQMHTACFPANYNTATYNIADGVLVGNEWDLKGIRDFDGDGDDDLLWQRNDGLVQLWEMQDGDRLTRHDLISPSAIQSGWSLRGVGDFDNDGIGDLLWQDSNGQVFAMNGATSFASILASAGHSPAPPQPTTEPPAPVPPTAELQAPPPPVTAPLNAPTVSNTPSGTTLSAAQFQAQVPTGDASFVLHRKSRLDTTATTYVITHGWRNNVDDDQWIKKMADDVLTNDPAANVILTDWRSGSETAKTIEGYQSSIAATTDVGSQISQLLFNLRVNPSKVQLVGHSLGAHISGIAGSEFQQLTGASSGQGLGMIVGLDPAGPLYEPGDALIFNVSGLPGLPIGIRLDAGDAQRVVAVHTDEFAGYDGRLGDVDIHVNPDRANLDTVYLGRGRQPGRSNDHNYAGVLYRELLVGNSFGQNANVGGTFNYNDILNLPAGRHDVYTVNKPISVVSVDKFAPGAPFAGGAGNDVFTGSRANDDMRGGAGNDTLNGRGGNDILSGGDGNDQLDGGDGDDILDGGRGSDRLIGGAGNDSLWAQYSYMARTGNNILEGGSGNDALYGHVGDDTLMGGSGNDTIDGSGGVDTVSFADATAGVMVNLAQGTATSTDGNDTLTGVESIVGSNHNDTLLAQGSGDASVPYVFDGGAGDDRLTIGQGYSTLSGGAGADIVVFDLAQIAGNPTYQTIQDFDSDQGDQFEIQNLPSGSKVTSLARPGGAILYLGDDANPFREPFADFRNLSATSLGAIQNQISQMNQPTVVENPGGLTVITGTSGDDVLLGGSGAHKLVGGAGADTFVLDMNVILGNQFQGNQATTNALYYDSYRIIEDFNVAEGDRIEIRNAPAGAELFYQRVFTSGAMGKFTTRGGQLGTITFAEFTQFSDQSELTLLFNTPGVNMYFG